MSGQVMERFDAGMVFVLNNQKSPDQSKLLHLEWAVISQLDGQKTVGQISENLDLNEKEIGEIFRKLLSEQLILLLNRPGGDNRVSPDFFRLLGHEMTLLLGPVAGIILEDVLDMMRTNRDIIEKRNLPVLIDLLTVQIDDPVKQMEFQRNIYAKVKTHFGI